MEEKIYSFSQLSSFSECPYGYYLSRIEKVLSTSSAFAEYGSLIHDIIDKWGKKIITKAEMITDYEKRYSNEVVSSFPRFLAAKNYAKTAYDMGYNYLKNFDEFIGFEVLSTEEKFIIDIPLKDGTTRKFTGIIDMLLKDELTDELIICDHKSKSISAFKQAEKDMYKQQIIYSLYVKEKYNKWPDRLMFNLFKENGMKKEKRFNEDELNDVLQWATDIIHCIETYDTLDWLECKKQDMFCMEICGARKSCPNGIQTITKKKKKE